MPTKGHGTPAGYKAGCKSRGGCPAELACVDANIRYNADNSFRKAIDAGIPVDLILEQDGPAPAAETPKPKPRPNRPTVTELAASSPAMAGLLDHFGIPPRKDDVTLVSEGTIAHPASSDRILTTPALPDGTPELGPVRFDTHGNTDDQPHTEAYMVEGAPGGIAIVNPDGERILNALSAAEDPFNGRHLLGCPADEDADSCTCPPVAGLLEALAASASLPGNSVIITGGLRRALASTLEELTRTLLLREHAYVQLRTQNTRLLRKVSQ